MNKSISDEDIEIIRKITLEHMEKLDVGASYMHYLVFGEVKLIYKDEK